MKLIGEITDNTTYANKIASFRKKHFFLAISIITCKVLDLQRSATTQIKDHEKIFSNALIFCIFNHENLKYDN